MGSSGGSRRKVERGKHCNAAITGLYKRKHHLHKNSVDRDRYAILSSIIDAPREVNMKVLDLIQDGSFKVLNEGNNQEREIRMPYCCDLLSVAMGRMPADSAWITVMGNINTLAVATLADAACIILAEGSHLDDTAMSKAKQQEITVFETELPIFEAAYIVYRKLHA